MPVDLKALVKDKRLWAAGGVGGGLGLLVYLNRQREQGAGGATVATGQPISPAVADSGAVDAYNNLQSEIENIQGQLTALYNGAPLPTAQQAVRPNPNPTVRPRYVTTPKLGGRGGHPVSYDYLAKVGLLRLQGDGRYVTTGRFGTSVGHPVTYDYLVKTGYLRSA